MYEITKCRMCKRGICKPKEYCSIRCQEYWDSGFRIGETYSTDFSVRDWNIVAGKGRFYHG